MPPEVLETDYEQWTDERLLKLYQRRRDQHAFKWLVQRHGPMVLDVARRMLGCPHAAEDVSQATFLVLAKDARRIRKPGALASWLYGIAYRISVRLIAQRSRQTTSVLRDDVMVSADPLEKLSAQFEQNAVLDEVHRLPEKVRAAIVLRYLQGKSNAEVAKALRVRESTVEGRLKRGRNQLRRHLTRQGVTFAAAVTLLQAVASRATATPSRRFVETIVASCDDTGVETDIPRDEVLRLAQQELNKMVLSSTLKTLLIATLATGMLTAGWMCSGNGLLRAQGDDPFGEVVVETTPAGDGQTSFPVTIAKPDNSQVATPNKSGDPFGATVDDSDPFAGPVQSASDDPIHLKQLSPAEQKTYNALRQPTTFDFLDEPLTVVVHYLEDLHGIQIVIDERALEDHGISSDVAVNVSLRDIQLSSGLTHILRPSGLTTIVKDEVLLVTTPEFAEQYTEIRVYRSRAAWGIPTPALVELISTSIAPETWSDVGGEGAIAAVDGGIVVRQTQAVHQEISELLEQLSRLHDSR